MAETNNSDNRTTYIIEYAGYTKRGNLMGTGQLDIKIINAPYLRSSADYKELKDTIVERSGAHSVSILNIIKLPI